jgi:hypothetical protein
VIPHPAHYIDNRISEDGDCLIVTVEDSTGIVNRNWSSEFHDLV